MVEIYVNKTQDIVGLNEELYYKALYSFYNLFPPEQYIIDLLRTNQVITIKHIDMPKSTKFKAIKLLLQYNLIIKLFRGNYTINENIRPSILKIIE